jgi:1-acyl-sn-glycerol-3-phosphate acyltransferase
LTEPEPPTPPAESRENTDALGTPVRPFRPGMRPSWRIVSAVIRGMARVAFRMEVIHPERIPADGAFLAAATHTSHLDPVFLGPLLRRELYYLARTGILKTPGVGHWCRHFNTLAIRRGGSDRQALRACRKVLQAGWPLIFFPEGTRSTDGRLGEIQAGFAMILDGLDVPYLPIVMQDTFRIMPRNAWFPRPVKLRVTIGEPAMLPPRQPGEPARAWTARCTADLEQRYRALGAQ